MNKRSKLWMITISILALVSCSTDDILNDDFLIIWQYPYYSRRSRHIYYSCRLYGPVGNGNYSLR